MPGLKTIIALSFILALGCLLVILSSALYGNYRPLLVVGTFVAAPIPNWLCGLAAARDADDFMMSSNEGGGMGGWVGFGRWLTGFLVVMGVALPIVLAHAAEITVTAMIMSIVGGLLIYGTIISFTMFFRQQDEF